jgi:hypothetical protein
LPDDVVAEHIQDALQKQPVGNRLRAGVFSARATATARSMPKAIVHDPRPNTHTLANGRIVTLGTPNQRTSTRSCYEL